MMRTKLMTSGPVATLSLANPPANTLDVPLMEEMIAHIEGLTRGKDRPRVLVLTSEVPGQFSQGIDPRAILETDMDGRKAVFLTLGRLVERLRFCGIPIVADVSGPALAGGAVLATLADFAVIDQQAGKICFSEVKVGLPLPRFVQELIRGKTPSSSWNDVMLLGKNVDAAEALRIGLANAVYKSPAEREEALRSIVGRIVRLAPAALSQTLRGMRAHERGMMDDFRENLGDFADFLTDDYLGKGLRAVVKGESPQF